LEDSLAWSPDGRRIAIARKRLMEVKVWDADGTRELVTLSGHTRYVSHIAWSPDSRRLASVSSDRTVKVWDAVLGQELLTLPEVSGSRLHWSADGRQLALAGVGSLTIWDASPGYEWGRKAGPGKPRKLLPPRP
jgi:WD40 repeat protein